MPQDSDENKKKIENTNQGHGLPLRCERSKTSEASEAFSKSLVGSWWDVSQQDDSKPDLSEAGKRKAMDEADKSWVL